MTENAEALGLPFIPAPSPEPCYKCNGSGVYCWGTVTNGVPAKRGPCFACKGKGFQTSDDERRNSYYWDHVDLSQFER